MLTIPQILLFVNDPRRSWKLIQFCNALKKGGLYILGHIIVTTEFQEYFPELKKQQTAWMKYIDFSKIKAFPQVSISPTVEWGARNIALSAGLGGMRPNIAITGFFNMEEYRESRPLIDLGPPPKSAAFRNRKVSILEAQLPTDSMRPERAVTPMSYVNILEDLLLCLQINVAVAKGFDGLKLPDSGKSPKKYIDLWPIRKYCILPHSALLIGRTEMSAVIHDPSSGDITTTNFDTYTLILQLGCILNTVRTWKKVYKLRVIVFVEYEDDVPEETDRVRKLLEKLRIQAELIVVWLATGDLRSYEIIVGGKQPGETEEDVRIQEVLEQETWWRELQAHRRGMHHAATPVPIQEVPELMEDANWPESSFQQLGRTDPSPLRRMSLQKIKHPKKRCSITGPGLLSVALNMRAQRLNPDALNGGYGSGTESSSDEESVSSAASENDMDEYTDEDEYEPEERNLIRPRRFSTGGVLLPRESETPIRSVAPVRPEGATRVKILSPPRVIEIDKSEASTPASPMINPAVARLRGETAAKVPRPVTPSFSSKAIPETQVAADDGPGPSIRFVDSEPTAPVETTPSPPGTIAILSFNDVPSRGQHVILNELMARYSQDTAVIFTTLPSPPPNSCQSEQDSLSYLEGLEVCGTCWNLSKAFRTLMWNSC
jgi:potassium/chloride transporter 9